MATDKASGEYVFVLKKVTWNRSMDRSRWEWCGTYATVKEANRGARRLKDSLTCEGIEQQWSWGRSNSGRVQYQCLSPTDGESYQIRIKPEPKCYCHVSGAALHFSLGSGLCDELAEKPWDELNSGTRTLLKQRALQQNGFAASLKAELTEDIKRNASHPLRKDVTWRFSVAKANQKELKDAFKKEHHDRMRKELKEEMTFQLWDEFVAEIKKENHQDLYDKAVEEVKDEEYISVYDDAITQCIDEMDDKVAESRLLGKEMLVAALSRVVDAPLNEQQKRKLHLEVEEMVSMVRPIAHDTMNGTRYISQRAMKEEFVRRKLAELPLSTMIGVTAMLDAIPDDDEFP